ncbi:methyltransferase domain-containing protein [Nocardia sp. NPDC004068]|uniref:class I SAM-dependent methyltransferase n=1 Tax=Nocardia sp. NPDC004068 TaxID=3364303 RepID=UPI003687E050
MGDSSLYLGVAEDYAATRPPYPPRVYDTLETACGKAFGELAVIDVGAGTGIASAAMAARGARVLAVEPSPDMVRRLRTHGRGVVAIRGDGNRLPVADDVADLVCYAQSWHWTDPRRSVPEALRVLRPGGLLALWWNVPDFDVAWVARQHERFRRRIPRYHGYAGKDATAALGAPPFELTLEQHTVRWTRAVSLVEHLRMLRTLSFVDALESSDRATVLDAERAALADEFPDGVVTESYRTELTLARPPASATRAGPGR